MPDSENRGLLSERTILITGGAGFIGANLTRTLVALGNRVTVLDNCSAGSREALEGLPVEFIEGDIRDSELVRRVVRAHDIIVHLAAQTGVPASVLDPRTDFEINARGTLNILEACREFQHEPTLGHDSATDSPLRRLIFASSNAPLGRQPPPASEDKAPLPISPYGASKLSGEAYCLGYNGTWGIETVILRFSNVYGPGSSHKGSVVARFFRDVLAGMPLTIHGDGEQTRDFLYVGDLCGAIIRAAESRVSGEVFHIATGQETSISDLAHRIARLTGYSDSFEHAEERPADIRKNYSNIAKAREVLQWTPRTSLADGLNLTWEWFRTVT